MIILHLGDLETKEEVLTLDQLTCNRLRTKGLIKKKTIVDLDSGRLNLDRLKKILKGCKIDVVLRTYSDSVATKVKKIVNRVDYSDRQESFNIFAILQSVFFEEEREKVYKELLKWKPPIEVLMKWIISNTDILNDRSNFRLLRIIDRYIYKSDFKIIYLLLSYYRPRYSPNKRFYYKFKKKQEE
jgi:hypothetical protein